MPIDPNISLSVKPLQLANPLQQYMQAQQIQQAQNQSRLADLMYGEKQQQIARGNNLLNLIKGLPQDATDDQRMNTLRGNGYFDEADKLDTSIQNRTKTKAEAQKNQADAMGKYLDATKQVAGRVMALPTPENANAALNSMEMLGKQLGFDVSADIASERQALAALKTPDEIKQWAASHAMAADKLLPKTDTRNLGGTTETISVDPVTGAVKTVNSVKNTQSPDNVATNATTRRSQDMTDARAREMAQLTREGQQTQVVTDPNQGVLLVNKGTKTAIPAKFEDGTVVPSANAVAAGKLNSQLMEGIKMARDLIPKATSSGAGALVDSTAGFFGKSTDGADAAAQLNTLAGWMTANVPRMQGPQSDKDVLLYRQMAADVGNSKLPSSRRLAALDTLEKLQGKYADINQGGGGKSPPSIPPANAKGWTLHVDANGNKAYVSPDGKSYEEVK